MLPCRHGTAPFLRNTFPALTNMISHLQQHVPCCFRQASSISRIIVEHLSFSFTTVPKTSIGHVRDPKTARGIPLHVLITSMMYFFSNMSTRDKMRNTASSRASLGDERSKDFRVVRPSRRFGTEVFGYMNMSDSAFIKSPG